MVVAGGLRVVVVENEYEIEQHQQHETNSVEFLSLQNLDKGWFKGK